LKWFQSRQVKSYKCESGCSLDGQDPRRVLGVSVADLVVSMRSQEPAKKATTTAASSNRSSLSASILFLRNNRAANLEAHLENSSSFRFPAHQVAAYREYEAREQLSYDNVSARS
jgi:hypothetical protein